MERTIFDIFKPEIDAKIDWAVKNAVSKTASETRHNMLYELVQDGDLTLGKAAKRIGMTPAEFSQHMKEAGYAISSQSGCA